MRINRTDRQIAESASSLPEVEKGWVREEILNILSSQPSTLTDISRKAGIAKSTASYHISRLLAKGAIVMIESPSKRGGIQVKRYGLREGSLVALLSSKDEEKELVRLRETFDVFTVRINSDQDVPKGEQIQGLLYLMFLHLFRVSKSDHRELMKDYGNRLWAKMAAKMPGGSLRETLLNFKSVHISDLGIIEFPSLGATVVISNSCLGSNFHPSNSCYFLEGMVEGAAKERYGPSARVARVAISGIPSCVLAISRGRKLDLPAIAEAVASSPDNYRTGISAGGRMV